MSKVILSSISDYTLKAALSSDPAHTVKSIKFDNKSTFKTKPVNLFYRSIYTEAIREALAFFGLRDSEGEYNFYREVVTSFVLNYRAKDPQAWEGLAASLEIDLKQRQEVDHHAFSASLERVYQLPPNTLVTASSQQTDITFETIEEMMNNEAVKIIGRRAYSDEISAEENRIAIRLPENLIKLINALDFSATFNDQSIGEKVRFILQAYLKHRFC